jgi:hypothetical protein
VRGLEQLDGEDAGRGDGVGDPDGQAVGPGGQCRGNRRRCDDFAADPVDLDRFDDRVGGRRATRAAGDEHRQLAEDWDKGFDHIGAA